MGGAGIFGTYFWVDRGEQLVAMLMHQMTPRNSRSSDVFQVLAYGAIQN